MRRDSLMVFATTKAHSWLLSAAVFVLLAYPSFLARADKVAAPTDTRLEEIVVTAKRRADPVADEKLKNQAEEALHADAFFFGEHVTVTISNGVATLQGRVFDDWDMRSTLRIARRIPDVKRVVNDLEIEFELAGGTIRFSSPQKWAALLAVQLATFNGCAVDLATTGRTAQVA
jgi:BON domain